MKQSCRPSVEGKLSKHSCGSRVVHYLTVLLAFNLVGGWWWWFNLAFASLITSRHCKIAFSIPSTSRPSQHYFRLENSIKQYNNNRQCHCLELHCYSSVFLLDHYSFLLFFFSSPIQFHGAKGSSQVLVVQPQRLRINLALARPCPQRNRQQLEVRMLPRVLLSYRP
jgi:hypothetical protein